MRRTVIPLLGALALCLALVAAAPARSLPKTWNGSGRQVVRPGQIWLSGDSTELLAGPGRHRTRSLRHVGRLHWRTYTRSRGVATGAVWLNDCSPNCALGSFHPAAVTVTVTRVRSGHFTRLTAVFRHNGRRVVERHRLFRAPRRGYFFW